MSKPPFDPTKPFEPVVKPAFDPSQAYSDASVQPKEPDLPVGQIATQAARAAVLGPYDATKYMAQNPAEMNDQLPMLGATAGSFAAPGVGTAVGAGLGQIGKRLSDLLYGKVQPADAMNPVHEAIGPMAQAAVSGIPDTAPAQALGSYVGKGLAKVASSFSGAKASDLQKAAAKGFSTYFAPSMKEASDGFGAALKKEGVSTTPSLEATIDPQLAQARDTAMKYGKKLNGEVEPLPAYQPGQTQDPHAVFQGNFDLGEGNKYSTYIVRGNHPRAGGNFGKEDLQSMGIPVVAAEGKGIGQIHDMATAGLTPQEALQGRQAVDRIIAGTPQKDKPTLLALGNLRDKFNQSLTDSSPGIAKASNDYADAVLKNNLTKVMPVNKGGEYSKLAPYLAAAAGSAVGYGHHNPGEGALAGGAYLLGTSPLAAGVAAATLGSITPQMRSAALASFVDRVITKKNQGN